MNPEDPIGSETFARESKKADGIMTFNGLQELTLFILPTEGLIQRRALPDGSPAFGTLKVSFLICAVR